MALEARAARPSRPRLTAVPAYVEVVAPSTLEEDGPALRELAPAPTVEAGVGEELQETVSLVAPRLPAALGRLASCRLEASPKVAAWLRTGALPGWDPLLPATLPEGCALTLEFAEGGARAPELAREVRRLDEDTVRITTVPVRGVVEEPLSGLLLSEPGLDVGGTHTIERALGWTADLDLGHPEAARYYREFLASGEVPVTNRSGGVRRSGRVAVFTDSCAPIVELRFLRDFAQLDSVRVESRQRVVEYDDGGVEVRSGARFSGRRRTFSTIVVDAAGQQVRGDQALVFEALSSTAVAMLGALFGEWHEVSGPCHARLRLTDDEAMHWRDLARARLCQQNGMALSRFEAGARTPEMVGWRGSAALVSLALARTPSEVVDAVARFHATAEGLVVCLVRLGADVHARLPGTLAIVPASET